MQQNNWKKNYYSNEVQMSASVSEATMKGHSVCIEICVLPKEIVCQ